MVRIVGLALFMIMGAQAAAAADGNAEAGRRLAARWCVQCHALDASATASDQADTLGALARDAEMTPDRLRGFLARPHGNMTGLSLTQQEIEDLIAYLQGLK